MCAKPNSQDSSFSRQVREVYGQDKDLCLSALNFYFFNDNLQRGELVEYLLKNISDPTINKEKVEEILDDSWFKGILISNLIMKPDIIHAIKRLASKDASWVAKADVGDFRPHIQQEILKELQKFHEQDKENAE